jgi:hypothetical protein
MKFYFNLILFAKDNNQVEILSQYFLEINPDAKDIELFLQNESNPGELHWEE